MNRLEVSDLSLRLRERLLLSGVSLAAQTGECLALMGPSGAGKTSLLNCIAGISTVDSGSVVVDGTDLTSLRAGQRSEFRLHHIGIVFQFGELLPELTMLDNVAMPLRLMRVPRRQAAQRAANWLDRLGLAERASAHPEVLSGGEIQRAAIARALVPEPVLVLADEPTGMLDEQNTRAVARLLVQIAHDVGVAVVVTTHDPLVASAADRVLHLRDGRVAADGSLAGQL